MSARTDLSGGRSAMVVPTATRLLIRPQSFPLDPRHPGGELHRSSGGQEAVVLGVNAPEKEKEKSNVLH
jgi:hypothetical protein